MFSSQRMPMPTPLKLLNRSRRRSIDAVDRNCQFWPMNPGFLPLSGWHLTPRAAHAIAASRMVVLDWGTRDILLLSKEASNERRSAPVEPLDHEPRGFAVFGLG